MRLSNAVDDVRKLQYNWMRRGPLFLAIINAQELIIVCIFAELYSFFKDAIQEIILLLQSLFAFIDKGSLLL